VTLCDLISEPREGDDKALLKDFEKAIQIASQTIEKLHIDLDKANF
jgi:propanediol utilization protein